eukprot:COSAG01_NODE_2213_length_8163_cov_18.627327_9_plen_193_part_00
MRLVTFAIAAVLLPTYLRLVRAAPEADDAAAERRMHRFREHYEGPPRSSLSQSLSPSVAKHGTPLTRTGAGSQPLWPQQIHMSLTGRPGEAVIEWVSGAPDGTSMVQISDEPGCCDNDLFAGKGGASNLGRPCPCFPYWCWRRNFSYTTSSKATRKIAGNGALLQDVRNFTATDWFRSAMPRRGVSMLIDSV